MNLRTLLKQYLPKPLVAAIKKVRYTHQIESLNDHSHPDFIGMGHLISDGDSVIDIGANMGIYTRYLSGAVGPEGTVLSIEPIPASFAVLSYMTKRLQLENVHLLNVAASDSHRAVTMEIPTSDSGEENLYEAKITDPGMHAGAHRVTVEARTLDELLPPDTRRLSLLKCDVEGHELQCLKGARTIIERYGPAWLIEIWGDLDDQKNPGVKTVSFLQDYGYELFVFDGQVFRPKQQGERDINYFFLNERHQKDLFSKHLLNRATIHANS